MSPLMKPFTLRFAHRPGAPHTRELTAVHSQTTHSLSHSFLTSPHRATLEEIQDASVLLHVVDISHPHAAAQCDAVLQVGASCWPPARPSLPQLPFPLFSQPVNPGLPRVTFHLERHCATPPRSFSPLGHSTLPLSPLCRCWTTWAYQTSRSSRHGTRSTAAQTLPR